MRPFQKLLRLPSAAGMEVLRGSRSLQTLVQPGATRLPESLLAAHPGMLAALSSRPLMTSPPVLGTQRDPERPKRALTPWVQFATSFREESKGKIESKEVLKAASAAWKVLDLEKKKPFEAEYEKNRAAYKQAFEEYTTSGRKAAWARDPEKPKKPLTAYFAFLQDYVKANPEVSSKAAKERVKLAAEAWKTLPDVQKEPYLLTYKQEKEAYDQKLTEYKESGKKELWEEKVGIAAQKAKKAQKVAAKKELDAQAKAKKAVKAAKAKAKQAADKAKLAAAKTKVKLAQLKALALTKPTAKAKAKVAKAKAKAPVKAQAKAKAKAKAKVAAKAKAKATPKAAAAKAKAKVLAKAAAKAKAKVAPAAAKAKAKATAAA